MEIKKIDKKRTDISIIREFFFFQAEDGIRDAQESRGLGDVYKRQGIYTVKGKISVPIPGS